MRRTSDLHPLCWNGCFHTGNDGSEVFLVMVGFRKTTLPSANVRSRRWDQWPGLTLSVLSISEGPCLASRQQPRPLFPRGTAPLHR